MCHERSFTADGGRSGRRHAAWPEPQTNGVAGKGGTETRSGGEGGEARTCTAGGSRSAPRRTGLGRQAALQGAAPLDPAHPANGLTSPTARHGGLPEPASVLPFPVLTLP